MSESNKTLVLSTIALMSPSEQAEVFAAIRDMQDKATTAAVQNIAARAKDQLIEKRVAKFVQLRDARAANTKLYELVDKQYKACLDAIEGSMLATAQEQGVTGFKTDAGTTYMEEMMQTSIADEALFFDFVRASGDLDFFERRLKVGHIKEYVDANGGLFPPGLNIFRELKMKVRRS